MICAFTTLCHFRSCHASILVSYLCACLFVYYCLRDFLTGFYKVHLPFLESDDCRKLWEILHMVLVFTLQSGSLEELFHRRSLDKERMLPVCTVVTYGIRGLFYSLHTHIHIYIKPSKIKQHLSLESQKELSWWGRERRTPQNAIIKLEGAHLFHVLHCPHQPRQ